MTASDRPAETFDRPRIVLAWDTATPWCTAALVRFGPGGEEILDEFASDQGLHSQLLPPRAALMLDQAGLKPADLDLVAVGRGPGSFTGLRTGLAMAKGLAMGAGTPLMGLTTLEILAALMLEGRTDDLLAAPLIDARHGEVYAALYRAGTSGRLSPEELMAPKPLAPENLSSALAKVSAGKKIIVAGPALNLVRGILGGLPEDWRPGPENLAPAAVMLARLAVDRFAAGPETALRLNPPLPMYIRQPDIRKSGLVMR